MHTARRRPHPAGRGSRQAAETSTAGRKVNRPTAYDPEKVRCSASLT